MNGGLALFARLTDDETVSGLISTRCYPETGKPGNRNFPQVVYKGPSEPDYHRRYSGDGNLVSATFELACIARTYGEATALAAAVREALDHQTGTWGTVEVVGCFHQSGSTSTDTADAGIDGELFVVESSYTLWTRP